MDFNNRRTVSDKISRYKPGYNLSDAQDFIELTEWYNGEGFDITIGENTIISLHRDDINAINHLINCLDYHTDD